MSKNEQDLIKAFKCSREYVRICKILAQKVQDILHWETMAKWFEIEITERSSYCGIVQDETR